MKLTLISSENNVKRLRCEGAVTATDFVSGANPFTDLLGPECYSEIVLVSLEHTSLIDTAGIGWLVMSHKRFQERGGKLVLHSIPPMVEHVFRLLRMPSVLHMAANESAAQKLIQGDKTTFDADRRQESGDRSQGSTNKSPLTPDSCPLTPDKLFGQFLVFDPVLS